MKIDKLHHFDARRTLIAMALNAGLLAATAIPLQADDSNSWIPAGMNEDEWYDPGDWFDGNNIEMDGSDWFLGDDDEWDDSYHSNNNTRSDANELANTRDDRSNRNTPAADNDTTGTLIVGPYYYYWDPLLVGWTTSDPQKRNQADNNQPNRMQASFKGKVDGFRTVNLTNKQGANEDQTFVRVRLKNGDARVVALGSRVDLSDLDLQKGDTISVAGKTAKIDNRNVLIAKRIKVDGETFRIREANRPEARQQTQQVNLNGTVREFSRTSFDGSRDQNLLVRMDLKNGKTCVVDLGKGTTIQELGLEEGATVHLEGRRTQVDGKRLIVAEKIRVDGEKTQLREKAKHADDKSWVEPYETENRRDDSRTNTKWESERSGNTPVNTTTDR